MNNTDKICSILNEIKLNLEKFEKETIEIISCDTENIEFHTQKRVDITKNIDGLFSQIDDICSQMKDGDEIRKIIRNVSLFTEVSEDTEKIFMKSQEIFSVFTRIKDSDIQAVNRINLEKEILIKKIKETNNGQQAKAAKFAVGLDDGTKKYLGDDIKKI